MGTDKSGQPSGMRANPLHQSQAPKPCAKKKTHEGSSTLHSQPLVPHQAASPVTEAETGKVNALFQLTSAGQEGGAEKMLEELGRAHSIITHTHTETLGQQVQKVPSPRTLPPVWTDR